MNEFIIKIIVNFVLLTFSDSSSSPLCDNESLQINSGVAFEDSETLYAFTGDIINIIETNRHEFFNVKNALKIVDFWNSSISTPIDAAFGFIHNKIRFLHITNVKFNKFWIINTEQNQIHSMGSLNINRDYNLIAVIKKPNTFGYVLFQSHDKTDILVLKFKYDFNSNAIYLSKDKLYLRQFINENKDKNSTENTIALLDENELNGSKPFKQLNGSDISAGIFHQNKWLLFGGQYYCLMEVEENTAKELCQIRKIKDLIVCNQTSNESLVFNSSKTSYFSTDISEKLSSTLSSTFSSTFSSAFSPTLWTIISSVNSSEKKEITTKSNSFVRSKSHIRIVLIVILLIVVIMSSVLYCIKQFCERSDREESDERQDIDTE